MTNEKHVEEYISFMNNPKNIGNCAACPENCTGRKDYLNLDTLPCGQYHCLVALTCEAPSSND